MSFHFSAKSFNNFKSLEFFFVLFRFLLCGEPTEGDALQPPYPINTVVRTYGETTAEECQPHQQQCSQPASSLNSTMASETSQSQDISMNISTSTPIKVIFFS